MEKPKIELKSVKYCAFASEETMCFEATMYVDGKRFCRVRNEGHGGADMYDKINGGHTGNLWDAVTELDKRIRATYPSVTFTEDVHGWDGEMEQSLECLCAELVNRHVTMRDLKNAMRHKWLFIKEPGGSIFECRRAKGQVAETMQEVIEKFHPRARLLNAMPEQEALDIWFSHHGLEVAA